MPPSTTTFSPPSMRSPVWVLLNPRAGRGRAKRAWESFRPQLVRAGIRHVTRTASCAAELTDLARRAAPDGAGAVIAVGGDGTINDVVNGLLAVSPCAVPLGVVPAGTGNDWLRGLPPRASGPGALAQSLLKGRVRRLDVGCVNGRYFVNNFGWGLEGRVAQGVPRLRPALGKARYALAMLSALSNRPAPAVEFEIDGNRQRLGVCSLSVANGRSTGGGFVLCPDARMDDGHLDLFVAHALGPGDVPVGLWHLLRGTQGRWPKAKLLRGREVRVRTDAPQPAHLDGNLLPGAIGEATIRVVPRALPVLN